MTRRSSSGAWITLYPSTITRSTSELVKAHVRLAEEDQAWVDARKSRDVEHQLKEGRAERRNEPERGEHRDDPELSVLDRQTLKRVGQPWADDAEPVEARHRQQVQHQRHRLDESQEGKRSEEVDIRLVDQCPVADDDKGEHDEHTAEQRAYR